MPPVIPGGRRARVRGIRQRTGIFKRETMAKKTPEEIISAFARTTEDIFTLEEFKSRLGDKKPMRIKYGVDVTAPTLHIGHAVNLWMMRDLQEEGHKVIFLIGDFTTAIGDPTGRSKLRPVIPEEEIRKNSEAFIEQASMVLLSDPEVVEIRRNSEWFAPMPTSKFISLLSMVTHSRLIARDMFQKRIQDEEEIHMHEIVYPILQGYDSEMIDSDLTIIGTDQLFNEMMGRFYQEKYGSRPQIIITTKITPGIDGKQKQSKSLGNYVGLSHTPRDKFGRIMKLPDDLIMDYFRVYTRLPEGDLAGLENEAAVDPMDCKLRLAEEIVTRYHGAEAAAEEKAWFVTTFSERKTPDEVPLVQMGADRASLFSILRRYFPDAVKSSNELKRLITQSAVSVNGEKVTDKGRMIDIDGEVVVKVGKRTWFKVER
jgi:tyrosyl-tRNA synthetase